jgi:hypothetical protein
MNRVHRFASHLSARVGSTSVEAVYRDRKAPGVVLTAQADDAIEYWLVQTRGEALLLPSPQSSSRYAEHAACFSGTAMPGALREAVPALLTRRGATYEVAAKGALL